MKHVFIINPTAGKAKAVKLIPAIKKFFENNPEDCHIELTKHIGHATDIVKDFATKGKHRFYAVGGDGTLNEVVNGLVGSDSSLAVIPAGSGNDFIKTICKRKDIYELLADTIKGTEKLIDIAKYNEKYFINISSVGFDAEAVHNAIGLKKLSLVPPKFIYYASIIKTLIKNKSYNVNISIDGKEINMNILLIAVANGKYYGGGIKPAPGAEIDDGMLDICLVGEKNRFDIIKTLPKYAKGKHLHISGVQLHKGKKIIISSDFDFPVNFDGESQRVKKAVFEIIPKGLCLIVPRSRQL